MAARSSGQGGPLGQAAHLLPGSEPQPVRDQVADQGQPRQRVELEERPPPGTGRAGRAGLRQGPHAEHGQQRHRVGPGQHRDGQEQPDQPPVPRSPRPQEPTPPCSPCRQDGGVEQHHDARLHPVDERLDHEGVGGHGHQRHGHDHRAPPAQVIGLLRALGSDPVPAPDRPPHGLGHQGQRQPVAGGLEHQQGPHRARPVHAQQVRNRRDEQPQRVVAVGQVDAVEGRAVTVGQVPGDPEVVEGVVEGQAERGVPPQHHDRHPHHRHEGDGRVERTDRPAGRRVHGLVGAGELGAGRAGHAITWSPRSSPRPGHAARS